MASLTGFFLQQLVHFGDCLAKDLAASASILRTNSYAPPERDDTGYIADLSSSMIAAINIGFLQSPGDQTNALATGCTSGNCTFADDDSAAFSTFAVTHLCQNLTSQIRELPRNDSHYNNTFLTLEYGGDKPYIWSINRKQTDETFSLATVWSWSMIPKSAIIKLFFVFTNDIGSTNWKAMSCSISPVINTWKASIKNTVLKETLLEETLVNKTNVSDAELTEWEWKWMFATVTKDTLRNGLRVPCEGSSSPAVGLTPFPIMSEDPSLPGHIDPTSEWKWWYYPEDCVWTMSDYAVWGMRRFLNSAFENQNVTQTYYPDIQDPGPFEGPVFLKYFFEEGNISFHSVDQRMKSLATAMSTVIRTSDRQPNSRWNRTRLTFAPATGIVWNTTTCVYIQLTWIAFPGVMISLTGLFLILVALENRGIKSDRLWKSSFLAVLFCELATHESPVGKREMHEVAKSTSVSLDGNSKALRLVAG